MIKVIVHVAKAIVAVVTALLFFSSCGLDGAFKKSVDGNGNVSTQNRKVTGDFTSITVEGGLEVIIEQSNEKAIVVEADENLQQHIKTEIKDDELHISSDVNFSSGSRKVTVRLPEIKEVEAAAGSNVSSKGTLKAAAISLESGSGSSLTLSLDADKVECDSGSGSSLKLEGTANKLETESGSGSTLNAKGLAAKKVVSDASSGSTTTVNPIESLAAEASSGGTIYFVKTPNELTKKTSSGGSVLQQ